MSQKYTGGFITKSPVAPTTTAASGVWTLDQQQQAQKAGTWPSPPMFIEDLFSTYLVTGDGTAPAVNNGIDLSTKGGLVWIKKRSAAGSNDVFDTARGANLRLITNDTAAQDSKNLSFTTTGFSNYTLDSSVTYASWSWAKAPKFFDVVTYTGDNTASKAISHNLGSVPGCVIVKRTDSTSHWFVWHRSTSGTPNNDYTLLNQTAATAVATNAWSSNAFTSTEFYVSNNLSTNVSGATYVAYLFAHNAGGFPASGGGSTNGISCGSYTGNGSSSGPEINLGYEAQWVMVKNASATGDWVMMDIMRGMTVSANDAFLLANTSDAESTGSNRIAPYANGFYLKTVSTSLNAAGNTYIYIAIRRGPMKPPTTGTSVYTPITYNGNGTSQTITGSVGVPDLGLGIGRSGGAAGSNAWYDRLRGKELALRSTLTNTEYNASPGGEGTMTNVMNGMRVENTYGILNDASTAYVLYFMSRAPGFFDEVCYTGTEVSGQTFNHNLGVVPEMMIVKARSGTTDWTVYHSALGASARIYLNATNAANTGTAAPWNSTAPTSTVFSLGNAGATNLSGTTFVNYLFATCAGVSKVGSYTGTGALQTVNCGFTSGARFVLIKRTDDIGDWWTYDSARGITAGDDPYLYLNSTAAEVTNTNYVDTDTTGFKVTAAAPAGLNANGGTYIFLAVA